MINDDLKFDGAGANLTEVSESLRLAAYPDPGTGGAPWTIGYGHTGPDVEPGMTCNAAQAQAWLMGDIATAENAVHRLVTVRLTQDQFDALVDFTFNLGARNLATSTLLKKLNAGDYAGADAEFGKWNMAAGKVLPGLTKRRAAEAGLFWGQEA